MVRRIAGHVGGNAVAYLALMVALGGTSYAAAQLPRNSVGSAQIRKGAVTLTKISRATQASLKGGKAGATGPAGAVGAAGLAGVPGTPGAKGDPGPSVSGGASVAASNPIALGATETVASLSADGTGPITVGFPARLVANAAVGAFKASYDATIVGALRCGITLTPQGGAEQTIGGRPTEGFNATTAGSAIERSLAATAVHDVDPGSYDVGVQCQAPAVGDNTSGISVRPVELSVVATAR